MNRTRGHTPLSLVLALVLSGCTATLAPAPGTTRLPGPNQAAIAESAGVRVAAAASAWRGYPLDLDDVVLPMLVVVENGGSRRLRIRYDDFWLAGADGRRFAAIPPYEVTGTVSEPIPAAYYPRPFLAGYYPGWGFGGPFLYDRLYYDPYWPFYGHYPAFAYVRLPTNDMIQRALPEGVVEPKGKISGFLYFERVPRKAREVTFTARLVDADSGTELGTITIPFVVD
jgi:hypothetical protein